MCGTTRPTKAMSPLTDTAAAVSSDAAAITMRRERPGFRPSDRASSSPTRSTSRCLRCSTRIPPQIPTYGPRIQTCVQPLVLSWPNSHDSTSRVRVSLSWPMA